MKCGCKRRVIVWMLLLLTGGAIVNVAVAWGCALWSRPDPDVWQALSDDVARDINEDYGPLTWPITPGAGEGERYWSIGKVVDFVIKGPPFPQGLPADARFFDDLPPKPWLFAIQRIRTGIPMFTLEQYSLSVDNGPVVKSRLSFPISIPALGLDATMSLPLKPLWPGFAINTIFYAAILWLLCFAPGRIRRLLRIKRHRCPACGYKIAQGVGSVCSECGTPLPPSLQCAA